MLLLTKAAAAWAQLVEEPSLSPLHAIARPTELTPASAATYHHDLQSAAHQAELLHGHSHRSLHAVSADAASRRRLTHGTVIDPVAFGADPTGQTDSTPAFNMAMAALLNHTEADRKMASGIVDLGGRTMSLGGGAFLLSSPLKIPEFFGNIHFRDGTLRAAPSFPGAEWLLSVGDVGCWPKLPSGKHDKQGSCNEFISLTNMLLDASDVAAGGVRISKTMGATLTSTFFLGFSQAETPSHPALPHAAQHLQHAPCRAVYALALPRGPFPCHYVSPSAPPRPGPSRWGCRSTRGTR